MSVFKRGNTYWYKFTFAGKEIRESAKTKNRSLALIAERKRHTEFEENFAGVSRERSQRVQKFSEAATKYQADYEVRNPRSKTYVKYAVAHLKEHLGSTLMGQIDATTVKEYQVARLKQNAGAKSINEEVGELLRILGERGDKLRATLKRQRALRLRVPMGPGKRFETAQQDALADAANKSRSPHLKHAQLLAKNCGMRDAEIKGLQWRQLDINRETNELTVGQGKTVKGEGRIIPLNKELLEGILERREWYTKKFGAINPDWYVFPYGRRGRLDPSRPVTTLKSAWQSAKKKAGVEGRWHDYRHTLISELDEAGAGAQTIKAIAGHVTQAMLDRYSHTNTKAKKRALEQVLVNRQNDRDERNNVTDTPSGTLEG